MILNAINMIYRIDPLDDLLPPSAAATWAILSPASLQPPPTVAPAGGLQRRPAGGDYILSVSVWTFKYACACIINVYIYIYVYVLIKK